MGCTSSQEKNSNSKKTGKQVNPEVQATNTVAPSTAFEIPLDDNATDQGKKKLPPLTVKSAAPAPLNDKQLKNQREKELNSKMDRAEQNKQALLQQKREKAKDRDERIKQTRERKNSISSMNKP
eukprot:NODE_121_length_17861_cov_0.498480.p17 type:complete len:124 gc:universal NODE_121_length_17861_cov_0.498480:3176-2805(-)